MSCASFIARSFALRTSAHLLHLSSKSYAEHVALNEFYEALVELTDRFSEVYMGLEGQITAFPAIAPPVGTPVVLLEAFLEMISSEFEETDSQALKNILAETEELTAQTLYKLKNLK